MFSNRRDPGEMSFGFHRARRRRFKNAFLCVLRGSAMRPFVEKRVYDIEGPVHPARQIILSDSAEYET
jgi:hypothetical protein